MTPTPTIHIDTPAGIIEAEVWSDKEFPGLQITVGGSLAVIVEYTNGRVVIRPYSAEGDEPITSLDFETGEVLRECEALA